MKVDRWVSHVNRIFILRFGLEDVCNRLQNNSFMCGLGDFLALSILYVHMSYKIKCLTFFTLKIFKKKIIVLVIDFSYSILKICLNKFTSLKNL